MSCAAVPERLELCLQYFDKFDAKFVNINV